jgi:hypothetical protein
MKSKKLLHAVLAAALAASAACDMSPVSAGGSYQPPDPPQDAVSGPRFISENERDELERNGRFLKLVNMPPDTQTPNVYSVSVANSQAVIAGFDRDRTVLVYKDTDSCTAYLLLAYNDGSEFTETGYFYTAFTVHVDAVTKFVVGIPDRFLVRYTDGRGSADVNGLPRPPPPPPDPPPEKLNYLTVFNLPPSVSVYNFDRVFVHNQAGEVAFCADYSEIVLASAGGRTSAKIPLRYTSTKAVFTETGVFYVSFDINVDVETRYTVKAEDGVGASFVNGNGYLDVLNIPDRPVSYLVVKGLPPNSVKYFVSDVNVYNLAEDPVAGCPDNKKITVVRDGEFAAFLIPLSSAYSDSGYFQASGRFAVTFAIELDMDWQTVFTREDRVVLVFTGGSAEIDLSSLFGRSSFSLANYNDTARPVIKAGSVWDVNGNRITVNSDFAVNALTPNSSGVVYLYSCYNGLDFYYEFSAAVPSYNSPRKGWYDGVRRALFKMVYLYGADPPLFLFKTPVDGDFPQLGKAVLEAPSDYSRLTASKPVSRSVDGAGSPAALTFSLDPGIYVIELRGAGGGSGRNYGGTSPGGSGGIVREIISLNAGTSFTAFAGSAGENAPAAEVSGTFRVVTTKNYYTYTPGVTSAPAPVLVSSNAVLSAVTVTGTNAAMSGGGGGGGGSGAFLYSSSNLGNYFLAAGGGSGGSGGSYLTPGGGGGSGGVIGPGSGGGGSGYLSQTSDAGDGSWNSKGGYGGRGGGLGAGSAGAPASDGGSGASALGFNSSVPGGAGAASYAASAFLILPSRIQNLFFTFYNQISSGSWEPDIGNPRESGDKIVTVRTAFNVSGNGGAGGSAPAYVNGPNAWLNVNNAGARGADAPALNPVSISNSATSGYAGALNTYWNIYGADGPATEPLFDSRIGLSVGAPANGRTGSDGGNNRGSAKGGGAAPGAAGSVIIHKIY